MINFDDLDVTTLDDSDGIVWRLDGRGVVRVRASRMVGMTDAEWLERLAREAAEYWARHQHAHHDRYECAIRLQDGAWAGPVVVRTTRPPATVKMVRAGRWASRMRDDLDRKLAHLARLRGEG